MIKLGTKNFGLHDFDKVRLGSELVYQKGNFAPQSTTLLMHLDGNLVNEVDGVTQELISGSYTQINGKFLYGHNVGYNNFVRTNYSYGLSATEMKSGNMSGTIALWAKYQSSSTTLSQFPTFSVVRFNGTEMTSQGTDLLTIDTTNRYLKFYNGVSQQSSQIYHKTFPNDFNVGEWHYYAFVVNQAKIYAFVDGELYTEGTIYSSIDAYTDKPYFTPYFDKMYKDFDEILVCKEALYLQNFTPPTKPWQLRT